MPADDYQETFVWEQTALDSLRITALAANSETGVFAGTCGDGLFRSGDMGSTWTKVAEDCIKSIAISANRDIFATIGIGGQLIRSSDKGQSWQLLSVDVGSPNLTTLAFNNGSDIFVGSAVSDESGGGVFRSVDNGNSWTQTDYPDSLSAFFLTISSNGMIFVGSAFGVFRSIDDGATWVQVNNGLSDGVPVVISIASHPLTGAIFVGIRDKGVYRSTNNGESWVLTNLQKPTIWSIMVDIAGGIFAGSGSYVSRYTPEGVFFSTDDGDTWTVMNTGLTNLNVVALATDSEGNAYAGTRGGGVFCSIIRE